MNNKFPFFVVGIVFDLMGRNVFPLGVGMKEKQYRSINTSAIG